MTVTKTKTISFTLPVYNESSGIAKFYHVFREAIGRLSDIYNIEIIFVNDGSSDNSLDLLKEILAVDGRIKIIDFSRNFGHQIAISAGIDYAKGDATIIMDTDLQDPPAVCLDLIKEWEKGFEVVYAKRRARKDGLFKIITAKAFYKILNILSDFDIPEDTGDFRLLDRKAVDALKRYREVNRFMRGIAAHIGFKQKAVLFDRDERIAGATHYPFKKMLKLSFDAILSFSNTPLRIINKVGLLISGISLLGILYAVLVRIFFPTVAVPGWAFIVVSIFFIGGVQTIMLGIMGEYIGRIYSESQRRPLYIVSAVHTKSNLLS